MEKRDAARKAKDSPPGEALSFETATQRLAVIVEELESGQLPLEKSLALFEEGVALSQAAQAKLDHAERRIDELLGVDAQGKAVTKPFAG